jgi:hypothetical protein
MAKTNEKKSLRKKKYMYVEEKTIQNTATIEVA